MTRHELIDAFVAGNIGRREFVRGLTALGVSAGAASAYALTLAPGAAAAGDPRPAGFVMRAQADDEEYGTACTLTDDLEGVLALVGAEGATAAILDAILGAFDETDIPSIALLEALQADLAEQLDALDTLVGDLGGSAPSAATAAEAPSSADTALAALADALNDAISLFVGVIPAIEDGETRQTLTTMLAVLARYAGVVSTLAGDTPTSGPFEQATCP